MACRSVERAEAAISDVRKEIEETLEKRHKKDGDHPKEWTTFGIPQVQSVDDVSLEAMTLDLSDLASVRSFVNAFQAKHQHLHYLILNAGLVLTLLDCPTCFSTWPDIVCLCGRRSGDYGEAEIGAGPRTHVRHQPPGPLLPHDPAA